MVCDVTTVFSALLFNSSVMTHGCLPPEEKFKLGITDNLLRVSVGLESVDDLIDDLKQAFESIDSEKRNRRIK